MIPRRAGPAPDARIDALSGVFRRADARMRELAFYNDALAVEAVDFVPWNGGWIGVVVSPWFMNAVFVPGAGAAWADRRTGDQVSLLLPSGVYRFTVAVGDGVGTYLSCSLFSPMVEFADQETARIAARAARATLLRPTADADGPAAAVPTDRPAAVGRRRLLVPGAAAAKGGAA